MQDFLINLDMTPCMHLVEISLFLTKSCHRQTYQNYEQPPQSLQNLYIQSHFRHQKSTKSFGIFFCEEYLTRRSTFVNVIFWQLCFLKMCPIFVGSVHNFGRCIHGLIPNLIKQSWTVSNPQLAQRFLLLSSIRWILALDFNKILHLIRMAKDNIL